MAGIEQSDAEVAVTVRDNPERSRYEVYADDDLAGFTQYQLGSHQIAFVHTETGPAFAGRGLAGRLVTAALNEVRQRGLAVLPFCPYVMKFIAKHPEYLDLVPAARRAEFDL
jgi:predicted GNAT family acetyltransferase